MDAGAFVRGPREVTAEVLVVGGGLAGSAAAIALARCGREVVLVEREARPAHKVCGEFLSREALAYLRVLGVDVEALGAVPISFVRLGGVKAELPFAAMSLTRRRLDEELLRIAAEVGVRVVRGCSVEGLRRESVGWCASATATSDAEGAKVTRRKTEIEARDVFLATGKHDLRGWARPAGRQNDLVAFKMYWRLRADQAKALSGCVELVTYRGGYAGLQPVEDGAANLCCLIERAELQRLGGRWEKVLAAMVAQSPLLAERLEGAEALMERALAVSAIPYGMVRESVAGVWCLGDQAAVIPSFTGDGMSIALHTGMMAAEMYLAGESAASFQERVKAELAQQVGVATWMSRGLVSRPGMVRAAVGMWPGVLKVVAERTRIDAERMLG